METIPTPTFYHYLTVESDSSSNPTFEIINVLAGSPHPAE